MLARLLRIAFVAYVIATALHIAYVVHHEPFAFDAWNFADDTHAEPFTVGRWLHYGVFEYTHSNPRFGQWFAYLAYKLDGFAEIATPLAFLATALAVFVLGAGRFPRWSRGRDLALFSVTLGFLWFAVPRIGMLMFCRAYATNYLYGAAIQLWFLVPLRLRPAGDSSVGAAIPYFVLGLAAGASNEHTGPTLVVFALALAAYRIYHAPTVPPRLAIAGAIGAVLGFAAIFFAPGQGERYDGLATQVSLGARLLQRGFTANLDIVRELVTAASPVLAILLVLLVVARRDRPPPEARTRALHFCAIALAGAALITMTLFVSPKLGPRFYMHASLLVLAAFVAIADTLLVTNARFIAPIVVALTASTYAAIRTMPLYARLQVESTARLAALAAAPRARVFTAEAFEQVDDNWWFLGDDFRDPRKRDLITRYFDLRGVIFRGIDLDAPLGLSDVKLVPHVTPGCTAPGFELGTLRGLDVEALAHAFRLATAETRARLPDMTHLDLAVEFAGDPPKLPRAKLLAGSWDARTGFLGWGGKLARGGVTTTRDVALPKDMPAGWDIVIYRVGDRWEDITATRQYKPWGAGAYWALACKADTCYVVAATRQL